MADSSAPAPAPAPKKRLRENSPFEIPKRPMKAKVREIMQEVAAEHGLEFTPKIMDDAFQWLQAIDERRIVDICSKANNITKLRKGITLNDVDLNVSLSIEKDSSISPASYSTMLEIMTPCTISSHYHNEILRLNDELQKLGNKRDKASRAERKNLNNQIRVYRSKLKHMRHPPALPSVPVAPITAQA